MITRSQFINAYKDRVPHRLDPSERIHGVCNHSLDINIQIDASPRSGAFLTDDYGRLTNTKSWYGPVVAGGMVVDMLVAADMGGIFLSFQVSHSIPQEIRDPFIPLVIQELRSLQLVAFEVAHRD